MLLPAYPIHFRKSARRRKPKPTAPLTLLSAEYNPGSSVRLTFNQAIDIAAIDPTQITIKDGPLIGASYVGMGPAAMFGANAVEFGLEETGPYAGADVLLTAMAANGIVASNGGGTWAGVTDMVVP